MTLSNLVPASLALVCALLLSGASCDEKRYLDLLERKAQPTSAELTQLSEYLDTYSAGSEVVGLMIAPVEVSSSSEPSSEAPVVVAEVPTPEPPKEPTWHIVCPEPFEWHGAMVQNPCWREYD